MAISAPSRVLHLTAFDWPHNLSTQETFLGGGLLSIVCDALVWEFVLTFTTNAFGRDYVYFGCNFCLLLCEEHRSSKRCTFRYSNVSLGPFDCVIKTVDVKWSHAK